MNTKNMQLEKPIDKVTLLGVELQPKEEINNMFIYYNNLLKSDLQDIKRLKDKKLIGPYQESYLKSFAGLWNYYYKRQRILSRGKVI